MTFVEQRNEPSVVPRQSGHVLRQRLVERIDQLGRVVVIRAEGGAGKTSLVASWLDQRRDDGWPTLWISLDSHCRSRKSFWHRTVASLLALDPALTDGALAQFAVGEVDASEVPGLLVQAVNSSGARLRLVLDDLHLLDDDAQEELTWVLSRAPGIRLVATSRTRTRLDEPVAAARIGVGVITSRELAMTLDELRELSGLLPRVLTEADLVVLAEVTHGNLLATRLAMNALASGEHDDTGTARTDLVATVGRLASRDLMPTFDDDAQLTSAMRLALAREVDVSLAADILGTEDPVPLLREFERRGLGQFRATHPRAVFSFHGLIAEALIRQAAKDLDPADVQRARRRAARRLAEWGDPVDVIGLLLAAGDDDEVWPFFTREFSELSVHRVDDLIRLFERLPMERFERHGTLALVFAIVLSEREARPSTRLKRLVDACLRHLDAQDAAPESAERFLLDVAHLAALRASRRYAAAAGYLERLQAHIGDPFAQTGNGQSPTTRELVVLQALSGSSSIPALAESLGVSVNTVKTQIRSLYRKLAVTNRTDAVAVGRQRGFL